MLAGNNTLYKDFSMSETILPEVFASPMPVAAPGLLDEIMAQTRFKPESESYDTGLPGPGPPSGRFFVPG